ncbi:MAG TPA: TonB-dependent receptor [Salinimicrobium sp.]|nr:TonB-dependent receptor [Salinimicrobium sp.]
MKKIILLLLLAAGNIGYGQNIFTGIVIDQLSGQPIPGATVYVPASGNGTITDLDGNFELKNIDEGTIEIVVSSLGYASKTLNIEFPETNYLEIKMLPSAIEMEEVIISTPFHQLQSENVMKVERENTDELAKKGALSLAEGITQITGVESISTGSGIGKPVIRGLSSNRVLVYTQGVRLENQQFGGEHGLGVNSSGVESVEVIKGPASLLYGSDALGGVLYLNPEKYAPEDSTEIDGKISYFSNTLGMEANAGFKTSAEKVKFLLRGNYATHSDYKTGNGKRITNTRFHSFDLKTGLGYRDDFYKADLRYNFNTNKTGFPEELSENSTSKTVLEPYQDVQNHILSLQNNFYLKNSSFDLKLGYLFNNRKEFEDHHEHSEEEDQAEIEAHGEEPALEMHLQTLNYDLKYHLPEKGNFETILGIQGMSQTNKNLGEEILIPDATTNDFGILGTTHYHLQKVDFQVGIRYDNRRIESEKYGIPEDEKFIPSLERNFNSFNGAFGVKIDLLKNFTSRINIATGFRAPNLAELTSDGSHHGSNRYEIGNPELENEQNYQIDLALEFRNDHLEIFGNAFYNRINDYIFLDPTGKIMDENPIFEYQQTDAELFGGEAGIHFHPHPLDWLHLESQFEMVIGKQINGNYLPLIPAHSVLNTLRMEFQKNSWLEESYGFVSLKSYFKQDKISRFEAPTAGYSLLSAGFGGSVILKGSEYQLRISGNNLLNKTYFSHLSRLKIDGIPNMGRNISLSLKTTF